MIYFKKVTKSYGSYTALDSVSFHIRPGEFVVITGPSGAGKTTIAKLLIHEVKPEKGKVKVGDFSVTKLRGSEIPTLRQQIGVVFQDFKLLHDRTAAENISIGLEIIGEKPKTIEKTVNKLLTVIGLEGKGDFFPDELSGGEQQRVVIARAVAVDPAILFADEPTGNLDHESAQTIIDLLKKINESGTTVLMATHDPIYTQIEGVRVIHLEGGQITSDTHPSDKHEELEDDHEEKTKTSKKKVAEEDEVVEELDEGITEEEIAEEVDGDIEVELETEEEVEEPKKKEVVEEL